MDILDSPITTVILLTMLTIVASLMRRMLRSSNKSDRDQTQRQSWYLIFIFDVTRSPVQIILNRVFISGVGNSQSQDIVTGEVANSFARQIEHDRFKHSIDKYTIDIIHLLPSKACKFSVNEVFW